MNLRNTTMNQSFGKMNKHRPKWWFQKAWSGVKNYVYKKVNRTITYLDKEFLMTDEELALYDDIVAGHVKWPELHSVYICKDCNNPLFIHEKR